MQKISYTGNGKTKEFHFNFPYFENSNIIVTKNNIPTTGYDVIGTSGGLNADIPYTGGKIVFETAPTVSDTITITRQLPLTRIVDYQPTDKLDPTILNHDANYLMEIIKDYKNELDDLHTKYSKIFDKESIAITLEQINAINDKIVAINAQIASLGDISTLQTNTITNSKNIGTNTDAITSLKDATNFTTFGKNTIVNLGKPSSRTTNFELATTGSFYTVPDDGWIYIRKATQADNQFIDIAVFYDDNLLYSIINCTPCSGIPRVCFFPVSKGMRFSVSYNATGTTEQFCFIYANGTNNN